MTLKIAAVDDDPISLKLLGKYLEALGHKTILYKDGQELIEMFTKNNCNCFDLIVTDYMMPHVNGRELIKYIRHQQNTQNLPIILQSAVVNLAEIEGLIDNKVVFVEKPLSKSKLQNAIEELISPGNIS